VTGIKEPDMLTGMTYLDGNPLDFHLTGREVSDSTQFETSLDIGPDVRPRIAMTEKGYDSQSNRTAALAHGITPVIPRRRNSKQRGRFFPKRLYKLRARIEQAIAKLKRFKRVAMRCIKTDISYSAIINSPASAAIDAGSGHSPLRSGQTAQVAGLSSGAVAPEPSRYPRTPAPTHRQAHQNQPRSAGGSSRTHDVRLHSTHQGK